jgi:hypothetical protein
MNCWLIAKNKNPQPKGSGFYHYLTLVCLKYLQNLYQ